MASVKGQKLNKLLLIIAMIGILVIAFVSLNRTDLKAFANDEIFATEGNLSTEKLYELDGDYTSGLTSGASIRLDGESLKESEGADPLNLYKLLSHSTNIVFSDPQLLDAIRNSRLTVDIEISGTNRIEILDNGVWTEDFGISSVLESNVETLFNIPSHQISKNISNLSGDFENYKVVSDLLLNTSILTSSTLKVELSSKASAKKEPSTPGKHETGVRIFTNVTSITFKLKFEKLKVNIAVEGATSGVGTISFNGDHNIQNDQNMTFEIDFRLIERDESSQAILNRPTFEAKKAIIDNRQYFFIGWTKIQDYIVSADHRQIYLYTNFLEQVPRGTTVYYKATYRLQSLNNDFDEIAYRPSNPNLPSLHILDSDKSQTGFHVGVIETYKDMVTGDILETRPTKVGNYLYTAQVTLGVPNVGSDYPPEKISTTITRAFRIIKANPNLSFSITRDDEEVILTPPSTESAEIYFGESLSFLNLKRSATYLGANLNGGTFSFVRDGNEGAEVISDNEVFIRQGSGDVKNRTIGQNRQYVRYVPQDTENYNTVYSYFNLNVIDGMQYIVLNNDANADIPKRTARFSFSYTDEIESGVKNNLREDSTLSNEVLKLSIEVSFADDSGNYFFLGISQQAYGMERHFFRDSGGTTQKFNFYFKNIQDTENTNEDIEKELRSIFQVNFIRDMTAHFGIEEPEDYNEYVMSYRGYQETIQIRYSNEDIIGAFINQSPIRYYVDCGTNESANLPMKIGRHKAVYTIYLSLSATAQDHFVIGERTLYIQINEAEISSTQFRATDKNNETGFATSEIVDLVSNNVGAGGIAKYYYSDDNKQSFHEIAGLIQNSTGCKLQFTPNIADNTSKVTEYYFIATHSANGTLKNYGGTEYRVVAESKVSYTSKIDKKIPNIVNIEPLGTNTWGQWTNNDFLIRVTLDHGGSGVKILYKKGSIGQYMDASGLVGMEQAGDGKTYDITITPETLTFDEDIYFKIQSGTKVESAVSEPFNVKIDKAIPICTLQAGIENKWYKNDVEIRFRLSEQGSGIGEIAESIFIEGSYDESTVSIDADNTLRFKTQGEGALMQYSVFVKDKAGNESQRRNFVVKVDKTDLRTAISSDDFKGVYNNALGEEITYIPGGDATKNWINKDLSFKFDLEVGASKVKIQYKKGDGSWEDFMTGFEGVLINNDKNILSKNFPLITNPAGESSLYAFRIINEVYDYMQTDAEKVGTFVEFNYGNISIDKTPLAITLPTEMTAWQNSPIDLVMQVLQPENAVYRSGIDTVWYDFGQRPNIESPDTKKAIQTGDVFQFTVTTSLALYVIAKDNAGNITEIHTANELNKYKVDPVNFTGEDITFDAYVGGGNPDDPDDQNVYPSTVYDLEQNVWANEHVRIIFKVKKIPASGLFIYQTSHTSGDVLITRAYAATQEEVGDVSPDYNSAHPYNKGTRVMSAYYINAMNISVGFVLKTGAGAEITLLEKGVAHINIDKVKPTISEVSKTSGGISFDFTANWTSQNSKMELSFVDDLSQIESIRLNKRSIGETSFIDVTGSELKTSETNPNLRYIDFTEYAEYKIIVRDKAGNSAERQFFSMIDKFSDFKMGELESLIIKSDSSSVLYEDRWLLSDEYILLNLPYEYLNDATSFGPSGIYVDFMRYGYPDYYRVLEINGDEQKFVHDESNKTFEMKISVSQVETYTRLRLITGAGISQELSINIKAKKDEMPTAFNVKGNEVGNLNLYSGNWTNKDIDLNLSLTSGPSAKNIYIAFGDAFSEDLDWLEIGSVSSPIQTFIYRVNTTQDKKAFFKLTSEQGDEKTTYYEDGFVIKIDKESINPQITGAINESENYLSEQWTDKEVILSFSKSANSISPITRIEIREDNFVNVWSGIDDKKTVDLPAANTLRQKRFSLIIENATGKVEESTIFNVYQSLITPAFSYEVTPDLNVPLVDGWYLSKAVVTLSVEDPDNANFYSKYKYFVRKKAPEDSEYGEWEPVSLVGSRFKLSDVNASGAKGGSDFQYSIKVSAPNGLSQVVEGASNLHIKIDEANYVAKITESVAGLEGNNYSTLQNHEFTVKRGANIPFILVSPKENYYYKSITTNYGSPQNQTFEKNERRNVTMAIGRDGTGQSFKITGKDVIIDIEYYRLLPITIINPERHMQDGSNFEEIKIETTDEDFISVFGPIKLPNEEYEGDCIRIKPNYFDENDNPLSEFPKTMGIYYVSFTAANLDDSDFIVDSVKREIKVNYFKGKGTYNSPYFINNANDFYAMGLYMKYESSYEIDDPYKYLNPEGGAIRYKAYFRQKENIYFQPRLFPELGKFPNEEGTDLVSDGSNASFVFKGVYDGDGFELVYRNVLNVNNENYGGFFGQLDGAKIRNVRTNLSVLMSQNAQNFGFIAAKAKDSMILYSYAIGQINIQNADANVGGLIGYAENTLVANSLVDIVINKASGTGTVGGIIGNSLNSYIINTYFTGQILGENIVNLGKEGTMYPENFIGGLIGYQEYAGANIIKVENFIKEFSININGEIQTGLSTGNDYALTTDKRLEFREQNIDELMNNTNQIILSTNGDRSKSVRDLVLYRIVELKSNLNIVGEGTAESPIIIDTVEKLNIISLIPWAYYRQTKDLDLDLYAHAEEGGEYCSLLSSSTFLGSYDGNNFALNLEGVLTSKSTYLGLFNILGGKISNLTIKGLNIRATSNQTIIVGGVAGLMLPQSEISNVHIGGTITVENADDVYAGSVVAIADNATIIDVVSSININIVNSKRALIGGLLAEARGATNLDSMILTSNLNVHASVSSKVGRLIGRGLSADVEVGEIRLVNDGLYVNNVRKKDNKQTLYDSMINTEFLSLTETPRDRVKTTTAIFTIGEYSMTLERHLSRVSNFDASKGFGTLENPYQIQNYGDLLAVSNNMNAYFILANDITIGDFNGDGIIDEDYRNDFESLGSNSPFNGHLNGNHKRINNLTAPLFNINAGSILNLQIDANYQLETDEEGSILFGTVARENYSTGYIIGVTVTGSINIFAPNANVVAGTIVGKNYGLEVKANTVNIEEFNVFAKQTIFGGIMGIATEKRVELLLNSANRFITVTYAVANGLYVSAGYLIGFLESDLDTPPDIGPLSTGVIYKNGEALSNRIYRIGNYPSSE